jgi:UDP-N-acetylglucosamine transferase subunit ALG13
MPGRRKGSEEASMSAAVEGLEFAPYEEIVKLCTDATSVISHGGVGTIMTALGAGKRPVVIPRLAKFGEHVDDHQLQLARAFADRQLVVVVEDAALIADAIDRARALRGSVGRNERLRRAVAAAVG